MKHLNTIHKRGGKISLFNVNIVPVCIIAVFILLICGGEVYAMYPYYTGEGYVYMEGGVQVIDGVFSFAAPFRNGFAVVKKDGRAGVIGTDGKFVIKPDFDRITDLSDDIPCFMALNYSTKYKTTWSIFGKGGYSVKYVKYKLCDSLGKSFYSYSGKDGYDPAVYVFKDRVFVSGENTEVFAGNGKGRIKPLRKLKRLYAIADYNRWLKNENGKISLCAVDTGKCETETYTEVKYEYMEFKLIKSSGGKYYLVQYDGMKEIGVNKDEYPLMNMLLTAEQQIALQELPGHEIRLHENRPFDDGSVVIRSSEGSFYITPEGRPHKLPQYSLITYLAPDTVILTKRADEKWVSCIYSPIDEVFVLDWQDFAINARSKNRERFVTENGNGISRLINRQGETIGTEYRSITATSDPLLYLADSVYIFAEDGRELQILPAK